MSLTRRDFLKKTAILTGGVAVAATVPSVLMAKPKEATITLGAGPDKGTYPGLPLSTRPTYNASDPDFNGHPSISFSGKTERALTNEEMNHIGQSLAKRH